MILLAAALSVTIALLRQSADIKTQSEKLITNRNDTVLHELQER